MTNPDAAKLDFVGDTVSFVGGRIIINKNRNNNYKNNTIIHLKTVMIMRQKLLSILALLCLTVTSAWANDYTSFSGGEVLKPGDTFSIAEDWEINGMVFQSSNSPFTVLRADVLPGEPGEPVTVMVNPENGMFYVIKDNADSYYFTDTDEGKFNLIFALDKSTDPPTSYDGIAVTKTDDTHYTFAGHEVPAATSGYCGDPSDNDGKNVTWKLTGTTITISGTGAMANFDSPYMGYGTPAPWLAAYADDITNIVIEEGVTTVGEYAFEDCHLVESISIPASVTSIGKMAFYSCGYTDDWTTTDLTVTIASGSNLETIGNSAFEYCQMASFSIPNGVKTIDEGAFSYCFGLTSIEMPASVTSIGQNAFYLCKNLATLTLNSNPFIDATAFNYAGESVGVFPGSTTVTMNLTATVGTTGEYWMTFYNQNHNFQVPATGTQIFKAALGGDKLLLTELTTDKRVNANNAVILKSATASITLTRTTAGSSNDFTGNDLAGVSAVAGATSDGTFYALNDGTQDVGFYRVASGTKVALGDAYVTSTSSSDFLPFVTVLASGSCGTSVNYSLTSDGVMTISGTGEMAECDPAPWDANKDVITSIVIGEGVTTIADNAFEECENVESVSIPASVTSIGGSAFSLAGTSATTMTVTIAAGSNLATIGGDAFSFCSSLKTITIPSSVTTIGMRAFVMSGLTSVTLSDGLKVIDGRAFMRCPMTTITIPASVTSIGESAFYWCSNLATVTLNSNPFIRENAFADIAAGAAVTMNLTANAADDAKWATFYNKLYSFEADPSTQVFKAELSGSTITLHEVTKRIVDAGTAVVLKSTGNPVMTLTTEASSNSDSNSLEGVSDAAGMTADDSSTTYVLNNGTQGVGFYKLKAGKTLGVGKAYLTYSGAAGAPSFFGLENTTGINALNVERETLNGDAYNLAGQRVAQPTKGLYIVNGKKVVIK